MSVTPNKAKTHRVCINLGGNRLSYEGLTDTQCAILITTKVLLKGVVSAIIEKLMCSNIHDFYYNTPMENFDYMKLPLSISPNK